MKTPDRRCKGCEYWRALAAGSGAMACHYCLDRHELRKRDGKKCLSFKAKRTPVGQTAADSAVVGGNPSVSAKR